MWQRCLNCQFTRFFQLTWYESNENDGAEIKFESSSWQIWINIGANHHSMPQINKWLINSTHQEWRQWSGSVSELPKGSHCEHGLHRENVCENWDHCFGFGKKKSSIIFIDNVQTIFLRQQTSCFNIKLFLADLLLEPQFQVCPVTVYGQVINTHVN